MIVYRTACLLGLCLVLLTACQTAGTLRDINTTLDTPAPPAPPEPPTLTLERATPRSLVLTWSPETTNTTDNVAPITAFTLRHSLTGANWASLPADLSTGTAYTHQNLDPLTLHYYQVRAESASGPSSWSNTLVAQTTAAPGVPPAPEPETNITDSGLITLSWTIALEEDDLPLTAFTIETSLDAIDFSPAASLSPRARVWTHQRAEPDATHYYRIRARNETGPGPWSRTVEATQHTTSPARVPPRPDQLTARTLDHDTVEITWTTPAPEQNQPAPETYDLLWLKAAHTQDWHLEANIDAPLFIHTDLEPDSVYYYRVRSRAGPLHSTWTDPISTTTSSQQTDVPGQPTNVLAEPLRVVHPDCEPQDTTDQEDQEQEPMPLPAGCRSWAITLSWQAPPPPNPTAAISHFELQWSLTGTDPWNVLNAHVLPTATAVSHANLLGATTYYYRLRAHSPTSPTPGPWSPTVSARTDEGYPPSAPHLNATRTNTAQGNAQVTLRATRHLADSATVIHTWIIERAIATDTHPDCRSAPTETFNRFTDPLSTATSHSFLDPIFAADAHRNRCYRIAAINDYGTGRFSNRVVVRSPAPGESDAHPSVILNLHAQIADAAGNLITTPSTDFSDFSLLVTWDPPLDTAGYQITNYLLQIRPAATSNSNPRWYAAATVPATAAPLYQHTLDYHAYALREPLLVRVRAQSPGGSSPWPTPVRSALANLSITAPAGIAEPATATDTVDARFTVRLDRQVDNTVQITYATRPSATNGATPGRDYTTRTGTLVFYPGITEHHIDVPILHDDLDDTDEGLRIVLRNPVHANLAADAAEATIRITNEGVLPRAWLARATRAHTDDVAQAIAARAARWPTRNEGSAWTRISHQAISGHERATRLDGHSQTAQIGIDAGNPSLRAGIALALNRASGTASLPVHAPTSLHNDVASLHPYLLWRPRANLTTWATAGYGTGNLRITPAGAPVLRTDYDLLTAALGTQQRLTPANDPLDLSVHTDALYAASRSDAIPGMAATRAETAHLRLALHARRDILHPTGLRLSPAGAIGLRADAGDADKGVGAHAATSLSLTAPNSRLKAQLSASATWWHRDHDVQNWAFSATATYRAHPSGRGLTLSLSPALGITRPPDTPLAWSTYASERAPTLHAHAQYRLFTPTLSFPLTPFVSLAMHPQAHLVRTGTRFHLNPHLEALLFADWPTDAEPALGAHSTLHF